MTFRLGQVKLPLRVTSAGCVAHFDLGMVPDGVIPDSGAIFGLEVRFARTATPSGSEDWAIVTWLREEED